MALNKSKGNMYEFITHTWNPLAGECLHKCTYCSTHRLKARSPLLSAKYSNEMRADKSNFMNFGKKGKFIFVVSQNDLFANEVRDSTISRILTHCNKKENKEQQFLFQTRNIERFQEWLVQGLIPYNSVICTTLETNRETSDISNAPETWNRSFDMWQINNVIDCYVTIEPIMDFDLIEFVAMIKQTGAKQVNIGADSGNNNLQEPSKDKILKLISELEKFTTVNQKTNLKRLLS